MVIIVNVHEENSVDEYLLHNGLVDSYIYLTIIIE